MNNTRIQETVKLTKKIFPVRKEVEERKTWAKFGDVV